MTTILRPDEPDEPDNPDRPDRPDRPIKKERRDYLRVAGLTVLLLSGVALLSTYLVGKSASFKPDFLARVFLFGFTLVNLTMLLVLVFVLGRNLVKLFLERRRSVRGAKFKTKLVIIFMGFALLPSALIVLVGSNLISTAVERWFSHPVEAVLVGAQHIVENYYQEKQESATFYARRLSREIGSEGLLEPARLSRMSRTMEARLTQYRLDMITVLSSEQALWTSARPGLPRYNPDSTIRLAETGLRGDERLHQDSLGDGTLVQYVSPVFRGDTRDVAGAVVVSYFIPKSIAATLEDVNQQANVYQQAEAQKEPIQDLYLSYFVMVSLLLLLASTWIGLYLAKRITGPVGQLVEATERVMAGDLDHPVSGAAVDELGLLMESFNRMTSKLKASQDRLEASRHDLETKNRELDRRRRYMETVLENITTGIVSFDREGFVTRLNQAALRLLDLDVEDDVPGRHYREIFGREELTPLRKLLDDMTAAEGAPAVEEELDVSVRERELHLSVYLTTITGADQEPSGLLMVLDDLTQLLRAQKVAAWREVARRLAHEIKNPLTPIQLSAQRIRKHFRQRSPELERVLEEGTGTIIEEVDSLKNLVDEFSQFARMPSVSAATHDLNALVRGTLELYDGLFAELTLTRRLAPDVPPVLVDPELIRRVFINIIDNAIEANHGKGEVSVETGYDSALQMARVDVSDDGPGIAPADRDKLFLPYYSTKRRGSGLGLAIVKRIVAEHRGRIRVEENEPKGARFVIELPVEPSAAIGSERDRERGRSRSPIAAPAVTPGTLGSKDPT
jgi:two-component system, NtrC family, nitrogen regulation sensor histidine kinase NtrY